MQNFAAQAVIAIENTRLLSELRQSLEQQTATSNVLARHQLVARRAGTGLCGHARKCHADLRCEIRHHDAVRRRLVSRGGAAQRAAGICRSAPPRAAVFPGAEQSAGARRGDQSRPCKFPICGRTKCYLSGEQATVVIAERGGARTLIDIPMLKDGELVGVFGIYRQEVRPFTDKQIELVRTSPRRPSSPSRTRGCSTNCAAHDDLRALEQTATSEVLKVISSVRPANLEPVFRAMLENATRICEAEFGNCCCATATASAVAARARPLPTAYVEL